MSMVYSFPRAAVRNYRRVGTSKQKCLLSQFWSPEVWDASVSRALLPPKALGKNPFVPPSAAGGPRYSLIYDNIATIYVLYLHGLLCLSLWVHSQ